MSCFSHLNPVAGLENHSWSGQDWWRVMGPEMGTNHGWKWISSANWGSNWLNLGIWNGPFSVFFFSDIKLNQRPRWEKKLISTSEKHQIHFMKHTSLQEHPIETWRSIGFCMILNRILNITMIWNNLSAKISINVIVNDMCDMCYMMGFQC